MPHETHPDDGRRRLRIGKDRLGFSFTSSKPGYAYVLQDCRGRFDSEGKFEKYLNEQRDGLAGVLVRLRDRGGLEDAGMRHGDALDLADDDPAGVL